MAGLPPMSEMDKQLIDLMQAKFPVAARPYHEIAQQIGSTEQDVYNRVALLYEQDRIRRIGPIFDTYKIGYVSSLVGAVIPPERLDEVAAMVNKHPEVTHNYERNHEFNMWFTLIAPGYGRIEEILEQMRRETGVREFYSMPFTARYKVWVEFSTTGQDLNKPGPTLFKKDKTDSPCEITRADIPFVRAIQINIPFELRPYQAIALKAGMTEDAVIEKIRDWKKRHIIRRWGAIVRHQKIGYDHNAMGVWTVPPDRVDEYGMKIAAFDTVSHCYTRKAPPGWPYNLYSMVHGLSDQECIQAIETIAREVGLTQYGALFSQREFKRSDMEYFPDSDMKYFEEMD